MDKHSQESRKQAGLLKATSRSLLIVPAMFTASVALAMPGMEADKQLTQVDPNPGTSNEAPSNPSDTSTSPLNPRPSIFNEPPYNRSQRASPTDSNAAPTLEPTPGSGVTPTIPGNEGSPSTLPTMEPTPDSGVTPTTPDGQPAPSTPTTLPDPGATLQPPLPEEQQAPSATVMPVDGKINIKLINATNAAVTYQVVGDTNQRTLTGDSDVTLQDIKTPVTVTLVRQDGGLLKVSPQAASAGLLEVTLDVTTSLDESDSTMRVQQNGIVLLN